MSLKFIFNVSPQNGGNGKSALNTVITKIRFGVDSTRRYERKEWYVNHVTSGSVNKVYASLDYNEFGLVTPYGDMDLVNIGSGNDLLPDGTKPFSEPVMVYNQMEPEKHTSLEFWSEKYSWKWGQQNGGNLSRRCAKYWLCLKATPLTFLFHIQTLKRRCRQFRAVKQTSLPRKQQCRAFFSTYGLVRS